jgi:CRISPR-associated endoribonuclease Cas6
LRGALGLALRSITCDPACPGVKTCPYGRSCAYSRLFDPLPPPGAPSGMADPPRPIVFRARHLSGAVFAPESEFCFDVHLFATQPATAALLISAFREIAETGMGAQRGRAELFRVTTLNDQRQPGTELLTSEGPKVASGLVPVSLSLASLGPAQRMRIGFLTPTDLRKDQMHDAAPGFGFLFARLRDRISNLRAFYGAGPLEVDFSALGEQARGVSLISSSIRPVETVRTSRRTGQTHPIGGFTGTVEYAGLLDPFVPYCLAGQWTGVGRHAVWGNGEITVDWS